MKVRVILEFDLEDEDGTAAKSIERYREAASDTEHAIRTRLMAHGFLADDLLIGSWKLSTRVVDEAPADPDPPP
mgnify:CR=1 FL=1